MGNVLYLTLRYMARNRVKAALMSLAVGLTLLLPASVTLLVSRYNAEMRGRADATPLVLGSKGNRVDLVLQTLYFRSGRVDDVPYGLVGKVTRGQTARAIPMHVRYSAEDYPVVGTALDDYFAFRDLSYADGGPPTLLGQAVVGSEVAEILSVGVGDALTSDQANIYDISKATPLRMPIAGVLEPTGSADDRAIFVEIKTTWIIAGLGHGHDMTAHADAATHAATVTYAMITPENADSFHFHGDEAEFPLTGIIVRPNDDKARTLLSSRYNNSDSYQMLVPGRVMDELMGLVLRIKRLLDANLLLVGLAMGLMLGLVVMLSLRLRAAERATLHRLGCGRWLVVGMQAMELLIVLLMGVVIAGAGVALVYWLVPRVV